MPLLKWLAKLADRGRGAGLLLGFLNAWTIALVLYGVTDVELYLTSTQRGWLICAGLLTEVVGVALACALAAAAGRGPAQFLGFGVLCIGACGCFASAAATELIVFSVVAGVGGALVLAAAVEDVLSEGWGTRVWLRWAPWYAAGLAVGWVAGAHVPVAPWRSPGSYIIATEGWRLGFAACAALAVLLAVVTVVRWPGFETPLIAPDWVTVVSWTIGAGVLGYAAVDLSLRGWPDDMVTEPIAVVFLVLMAGYVVLHGRRRAPASVVGALLTAVLLSLAIGSAVAHIVSIEERAIDEAVSASMTLSALFATLLVFVAPILATYQVRGRLTVD